MRFIPLFCAGLRQAIAVRSCWVADLFIADPMPYQGRNKPTDIV
jgi:hypothetical protein